MMPNLGTLVLHAESTLIPGLDRAWIGWTAENPALSTVRVCSALRLWELPQHCRQVDMAQRMYRLIGTQVWLHITVLAVDVCDHASIDACGLTVPAQATPATTHESARTRIDRSNIVLRLPGLLPEPRLEYWAYPRTVLVSASIAVL